MATKSKSKTDLPQTTGYNQNDVVILELDPKNRVIVHLHGATVLSWICNGEEQLYLSSKSVFDNKKAIRGGIPIVFPNFGPWALGAQHGFARIKRWTNASPPSRNSSDGIEAVFTLCDDEETRHVWNYKFKIQYTVIFLEAQLNLNFIFKNTAAADTAAFDFTFLCHTYFQVADIQSVTLFGLKDSYYHDKVTGTKMVKEVGEQLKITGECDRIYEGVTDKCILEKSPKNILGITAFNLPDVVVWNPWKEKAKGMADLGENAWKNFLCVESGLVSGPQILEPGTEFACGVQYEVHGAV